MNANKELRDIITPRVDLRTWNVKLLPTIKNIPQKTKSKPYIITSINLFIFVMFILQNGQQ